LDKNRLFALTLKQHGAETLCVFDQIILLIKASEESDVSFQIKEATAFLETYKDDLQKLKAYSNIETISLTFKSENNENLAHYREFLSPDFYRLTKN
jgi:hypothetical protein